MGTSSRSRGEPAVLIRWLEPERASDELVQRSLAWMDREERSRWEALRHEPTRRASALGRLMMRQLVAAVAAVEPGAVAFRLGPHGRPEPESRHGDGCRLPPVNCSHTAGLVVVAAVDGDPTARLGIDCEARSRVPPRRSLDRFFSAEEASDLFRLSGEERQATFWRLWTLKEAWLKARGTGIAGGLSTSRIAFRDPAPPCLLSADDEDPAVWRLLEPDLLPRFQIALAVDRDWAADSAVRPAPFAEV